MRAIGTVCAIAMVIILQITTALAFDSGWKAVTMDEFEDLSISHGNVRINNFILSVDTTPFSGGLHVLEFSCSARNKGIESRKLSIQVVGVDQEGSFVFAISAEPLFGRISDGKTDDVNESIYAPSDALTKVDKVYVRVFGDF